MFDTFKRLSYNISKTNTYILMLTYSTSKIKDFVKFVTSYMQVRLSANLIFFACVTFISANFFFKNMIIRF